jgi:hypothetical protein
MQKIKSRRSFFRYMAVLGLVTFHSSPLHAKTAKEVVKYQETPKDGKVCRDCLHFIAETNECKTVAGPINPEGWCSIYFKNPMLKKDVNESNIT